ncbi:MAG: 30S ribosomal protein S4 [Clostridiales bacterium]|jgi:small subunit ribosomal protein S4|nr:30S ribosomal protein S4 [Clostridiales bacterium]
MSRYTGAVCKLCRREGKKLFLKGDRCYSNKCSVEIRNYAPGQHGQSRKKSSEYGIQLRAKQQARRYYGLSESQFHKYFLMAEKSNAITGEKLLQICESRLDNVVYSAGWANSRAEARQLVTHGHFTVNGAKVDIPSYLCKEGDVVAIKKSSLDSEKFKALLEADSRVIPVWIEKSAEGTEAKIAKLPERDQIELDVQETLIVEYYSK